MEFGCGFVIIEKHFTNTKAIQKIIHWILQFIRALDIPRIRAILAIVCFNVLAIVKMTLKIMSKLVKVWTFATRK